MGDENGGVGWLVPLPDGSTEKYYAQLPGEIGVVEVLLRGAPAEHLGGQLEDQGVGTICQAYVAYLDGLASKARLRFGSQA